MIRHGFGFVHSRSAVHCQSRSNLHLQISTTERSHESFSIITLLYAYSCVRCKEERLSSPTFSLTMSLNTVPLALRVTSVSLLLRNNLSRCFDLAPRSELYLGVDVISRNI
jgi:hypothetical protein